MKVPISWLKDFVDIQISPEEVAKRLTMTALEVEGVREVGKGITNVIIGIIKRKEKHPNADKLQVCIVSDGKKDIQVITAATNIKEGQKIPLAPEGARLATGITIKKTKLRGVDSFGMMCSPIELGISDDAKGITILDDDAPLGKNAVEYMDLSETILDVSILPNRADCMSIVGIARETAAALGQTPKWQKLDINIKEADEGISAQVEVVDKDLCPRYMCREIKDIKIGPSPQWMQKRLKSAGIRPINNIVDITNYVLIEMGQPLHAFDFDKITGGKIIVRRAKNGEKITTLDGEERELDGDDLLIADVGRPLALAGIMGGEGSEVQDSTNHILLESAYFDPVNTRRTSFKLGQHTESSQRFERGVDWNGIRKALDRAAYLFQEYAEGMVLRRVVDIRDAEFAKGKTGRKVILNKDKLNKLIGIELTGQQIAGFLKMLDYKVRGDNHLEVEIPSWRTDDVFREADLCEEVARLFGYENVPSTLPSESVPVRQKSRREEVVEMIKDTLLGCGLSEIITYNLVSKDSIKLIDAEKVYTRKVLLDNPLSNEDSMLRENMIHSMLTIAQKNLNHQNSDFGFFEFGKVFLSSKEEINEKLVLSGVLCGRVLDGIHEMNIKSKVNVDFYYLKGIIEQVINNLFISGILFDESDHPSLQLGRKANVKIGEETIGMFGEISSKVKRNYDIKHDLYYFEIDVEKITKFYNTDIKYKKLSKFPHSVKDVAISIDDEIKYSDVIEVLSQAGSKILKKIELFDRYSGEKLGRGKISLAFHLYYGSEDATLTDEEINSEHDRLKKLLVKKLRAQIR